jgi:thiamine biosynthesis lipoprotein
MKPEPHIFRHEAMATWFEIRIVGEDAAYAKQAAQETFALLDRLEARLSRYREESEIARIRLLEPGEGLRLSRDTYDCLLLAMELATLTHGAFDPTLGASMDAIRTTRAPVLPADPDHAEPGRLEIDPDTLTVTRHGGRRVDLDLGAIGKGFALDRMAEELRNWEISRALFIAGGSSILALDPPSEEGGWEVRVNGTHLLSLRNASIGTSGMAVKGAHILDPGTKAPSSTSRRAWAVAPQAAWSDGLSTAFMILPWDEIEEICRTTPGLAAFVLENPNRPKSLKTTAVPAGQEFRPLRRGE